MEEHHHRLGSGGDTLMMLLWDGLQVWLGHNREAAILDPGFIRLVGVEMPTVDLRFAAEKQKFDPNKDGVRILRAAGCAQETFSRCREPWTNNLPGPFYSSSKLFLLQFRDTRAVVAAHFATPPSTALVMEIFLSLQWLPPQTWRPWCCYDMRFTTPPDYLLHKAVFQPGRFHLSFRKGRSTLIFDRLAPANVLLEKKTLLSWYVQAFPKDAGASTSILSRSDTEIALLRPPSFLARILPWLPGLRSGLRGQIRHAVDANKILMVTELGAALPDKDFKQVLDSYATPP